MQEKSTQKKCEREVKREIRKGEISSSFLPFLASSIGTQNSTERLGESFLEPSKQRSYPTAK